MISAVRATYRATWWDLLPQRELLVDDMSHALTYMCAWAEKSRALPQNSGIERLVVRVSKGIDQLRAAQSALRELELTADMVAESQDFESQ